MSQGARASGAVNAVRARPVGVFVVFFFNDTATTEIYTLSLHDALPILDNVLTKKRVVQSSHGQLHRAIRSEEHTSELQSRQYLVCRLLLEKKMRSAANGPVRRQMADGQHRLNEKWSTIHFGEIKVESPGVFFIFEATAGLNPLPPQAVLPI